MAFTSDVGCMCVEAFGFRVQVLGLFSVSFEHWAQESRLQPKFQFLPIPAQRQPPNPNLYIYIYIYIYIHTTEGPARDPTLNPKL